MLVGIALALALAATSAPPTDSVTDGDGRLVITGGEDLPGACYRHARRGDVHEDAVDVCTRAIERARLPINRTASIVNRGVVHYNGGRYALSAADFGAVIEAGSKNARVFVNRALAYEQLSQDARGAEAARYAGLARADYEAALALRPGDRTAKRRLGELAKPPLERTPLRGRVTA